MDNPRLRQLDLKPAKVEGEELFYLSDPSGIVEEVLVLHPGAVFIAMHLDGQHSLEEIHRNVESQFNVESLPENTVRDFVAQLDSYGFMDSLTFDAMHEAVVQGFYDCSTRASTLAGVSYPDDPVELRVFLDEQFMRDGAIGEACPESAEDTVPLPGLVVPHIDLHRGGHSYSHGYHALASGGKPETVIIFGVAHASEPVPFILTTKDFETPFGVMKTDTDIVERLASVASWDSFEYELTHRKEHSIEFQVLMLSYLYGSSVKIVPILTSYFGEGTEFLKEGDQGGVQKFLNECRAIVAEGKGKVTVISGVDLAHVGKCFGDDFDIDDDVIAGVEKRDREDMEHVEKVDAEAFYRSVLGDENRRNVCGLKAIYAGLYTLNGSISKGETLHYDYAHDPAGGVVSFTSIALR